MFREFPALTCTTTQRLSSPTLLGIYCRMSCRGQSLSCRAGKCRKCCHVPRISGTYLHDNSKIVQPDAFGDLLSNVVSRRQLFTLHEQHIFNPRLLNASGWT